jgi:formyltetrahydrofolate deformylase
VAAVKAAGLVDTLKSAGPFTVFAPVNAAFAALPAGTVDTLLKPENKAMLSDILTYHVVAGKLTAMTAMGGNACGRCFFQRKGATACCDNHSTMNSAYILTLSCPDRLGLVHAVSGFLLARSGNIEEAAQYNDRDTGLFFMRVQFACDALSHGDLKVQLAEFAAPFQMQWHLHARAQPMRAVIMVSKEGHCLNDLLFRWKSGLLPLDIRAIVSNHREFYQLAASYNVPFHHLPVTAATKAQVEAKQYEIIQAEEAELVVLARYMQVLSDDLCRKLSGRAINIHHSFLPSFKGAKPYYQAHDRGVKLIGATAHYVTADLDEGPIIEQDVTRVDHSKSIEDLTALGRDTESQVLARAVKWHSEHRVLINGHKTVIFK